MLFVHRYSFLFEKFIRLTIHWIVFYVIIDALVGCIIAIDVIVIPELLFEIGVDQFGLSVYTNFISMDNGCQIL